MLYEIDGASSTLACKRTEMVRPGSSYVRACKLEEQQDVSILKTIVAICSFFN